MTAAPKTAPNTAPNTARGTAPNAARAAPASRQSIPLEAFLAALPDAEAGAARAAAAQIDALEREIGPPGWLERHLMGLGLGTLGLFAAGVVLLLGRATGVAGWPASLALMPMLGAFPALVLAYLWSVRGRTRRDREKMALNERHFLPRGGLYFGTRGGAPEGRPGEAPRVLRVERPARDEPTLREKTERLHADATRRRWWW